MAQNHPRVAPDTILDDRPIGIGRTLQKHASSPAPDNQSLAPPAAADQTDPSLGLFWMADSDNESGGHNSGELSAREQDRFLPIANVSRIMKKALPANAKISKDAKETVQECVSEFISFITGEASDKCQREKRKTINGDDLLWAMTTLGFEDYVDPLKVYLNRYRETEGEKSSSSSAAAATGRQPDMDASVGGGGGGLQPSVMMMSHGQHHYHHHHQGQVYGSGSFHHMTVGGGSGAAEKGAGPRSSGGSSGGGGGGAPTLRSR